MSVSTALPRPPSDSPPDRGDQSVRPTRRSVHDPFCIVVWKFRIDDEHIDKFHGVCDAAAANLVDQPKTLFQRLTRTSGNDFQVRAGLEDSFGVLRHVVAFSEALGQIIELGGYRGLEVHGPTSELKELREPLQPFAPIFVERVASSLV